MSIIFTPQNIGSLQVPNRLVRSATAERLADEEGRSGPRLETLYRQLVRGGVGLIISGHMYVHPGGKAHPEMTGVYSDDLIPGLAKLADVVHQEGGLAAVQINHAGMKANGENVTEPVSPSALAAGPFAKRPTRALTADEIEMLVDAFAQAARRANEAGFDAVQLHGAHGYLVNQFLSPLTNRRTDEWGGSLENRMRFLRRIAAAVQTEVGPDYPVFIKLGMEDGHEGGLTLEDSLQVVASLAEMGIDAVEMSGGIGSTNSRKGVRKPSEEAYFLRFALAARQVTDLPILLVGGMRSRGVMEKVLQAGQADFISMCRPLINDPDFPNQLRDGVVDRSGCLSANNCWPVEMGTGIGCKCPVEKVKNR
jgi:2,4-dienoyl-CoA reductase-like NADH-dependent reductase (Old Yellow Enzyme family)